MIHFNGNGNEALRGRGHTGIGVHIYVTHGQSGNGQLCVFIDGECVCWRTPARRVVHSANNDGYALAVIQRKPHAAATLVISDDRECVNAVPIIVRAIRKRAQRTVHAFQMSVDREQTAPRKQRIRASHSTDPCT